MIDVKEICLRAREASYAMAGYTAEQKNGMLSVIASALGSRDNIIRLLKANSSDVELSKNSGREDTFIDRLTLNEKRVASMCEGLNQIMRLPDPVGEIVEKRNLPNGIKLKRVRAPLGVIGIIYEARPNVTVDAAALCLKSGNAVVLRGSKDALNSNRVLYEIMKGALESAGFQSDAVGFIDDPTRDASKLMLGLDDLIDVVIPRGGEGLKRFVLDNAAMPVIASAGGNCHIYVEKTADFDKAVPVIVNAKVQRPSTCNAAEHLLVDREIAESFLPVIYGALKANNVEIIGDEESRAILPDIGAASEEDFGTEFLTYKMTLSLVDGVEDAIARINRYGTRHSEAILTEDKTEAAYFEKNVDAAAIYVNASTRFTDGFEFGLGAEMGISTQKLHARGPIALRELTSVKYVLTGDGHVRK